MTSTNQSASSTIDTQVQPVISKPGPEHKYLDIFIGKWINKGHTVATADAPSVKILTSDTYEWAPGGFFVLHYAYGFVGNLSGGGVEILGYDAPRKKYSSHFFDSRGNVIVSELTLRDGVWTWTGDWPGEKHRATSRFSADGKIQTCLHERSVDGVRWTPSMEIVLTKSV